MPSQNPVQVGLWNLGGGGGWEQRELTANSTCSNFKLRHIQAQHVVYLAVTTKKHPRFVKRLLLYFQTVNMLYLQNFRQLWYDVFVSDLIKVIQVKAIFVKYSLRNINQELFSEGSFSHYE